MNNELIDKETINNFLLQRKVIWTKHCLNRMSKRDILISDVKTAINNGYIIEYYYNDYPYPSCLILGKDSNNRKIHIVCGISEEFVCIITAYYPDKEKWEKDFKRRRKK